MVFGVISALFLQPSHDGIMVAGLDAAVYGATVWLPVVRAEDVVYPHVKSREVVADAGTVAGGDEAVGEFSGNGVVGVGKGTVVEVAHADEGLVGVFAQETCHGTCLRGAQLTGFA